MFSFSENSRIPKTKSYTKAELPAAIQSRNNFRFTSRYWAISRGKLIHNRLPSMVPENAMLWGKEKCSLTPLRWLANWLCYCPTAPTKQTLSKFLWNETNLFLPTANNNLHVPAAHYLLSTYLLVYYLSTTIYLPVTSYYLLSTLDPPTCYLPIAYILPT